MQNKLFRFNYYDDTVIKIAYSMLTANQYKYGRNIPISLDIFKKIVKDNIIIDESNIKNISTEDYIVSNSNELTNLIYQIIEKAHNLGIIYGYGLISENKYKKINYGKNKNFIIKFLFTALGFSVQN